MCISCSPAWAKGIRRSCRTSRRARPLPSTGRSIRTRSCRRSAPTATCTSYLRSREAEAARAAGAGADLCRSSQPFARGARDPGHPDGQRGSCRCRPRTVQPRQAMIGILVRSLQRLYRWPSLLLGLAALFWAGNTVAARLAIDEISPLALTALRWVMVAAALWPVHGGDIRRHWPQIRPRLSLIVLLALLGMTGFNALYYVAAHYTSAINIGILQGAMPIFVLAGAYLAHGTRASLLQQAGVLMTALGVAVVATRGAPLSILEVDFNKGDLAMLAACVLYALYTIALRD